jgi:hypothetical protein
MSEHLNDQRPQEAPPLALHQRLALAAALRRIEQVTWRVEEQLRREAEPPLVLTKVIDPFSAQQRTALLERLQLLREEIAHMARDYRLEASTADLRSVVMAEFGLLWCDLEELRPARLSDYGALSAVAAQALALRIQRLIDLVLAVSAAVAERRAGPSPAEPGR